MTHIQITGTGLYTPENSVSNEELVTAFNAYVDAFNQQHETMIAAGEIEPLTPSSAEFIEKASGIKSRYVMDKSGIIDPTIMCPQLPARADNEPSVLAEIATHAARQALAEAGVAAKDVDAILVACSNLQRAYPAISIEVQELLGCGGFAFDMNVACSSATFGIQAAHDMIKSGSAKRILVLNPEICSGHLNFRDRDSHFIFGDVATAILLEDASISHNKYGFDIIGTKLITKFSNNIRNNFGFLNRCAPEDDNSTDKLFIQEGRKVFREVVPMVSQLIEEHLTSHQIQVTQLKRMWLHQANKNMNDLIAKKLLGRDPEEKEQPTVLDVYANTSSAGSIIAFHKYKDDFESGDLGVICSFGAGYSAGSVIVRHA